MGAVNQTCADFDMETSGSADMAHDASFENRREHMEQGTRNKEQGTRNGERESPPESGEPDLDVLEVLAVHPEELLVGLAAAVARCAHQPSGFVELEVHGRAWEDGVR